jgi:hypothetical protein
VRNRFPQQFVGMHAMFGEAVAQRSRESNQPVKAKACRGKFSNARPRSQPRTPFATTRVLSSGSAVYSQGPLTSSLNKITRFSVKD